MGTNLPNFDRADYVQPPDYSGTPQGSADHAIFVKSITYGVGAAIVGCLIYAAFTIVTHIEIGYLALGVGWLVAKAMMTASDNLGGRKYQIAAALLTYFAVSMAAVPELLWGMHQSGKTVTHVTAGLVGALAQYGLASPFLELAGGIGGVIGLVILFVGIRTAWQMTKGTRSY